MAATFVRNLARAFPRVPDFIPAPAYELARELELTHAAALALEFRALSSSGELEWQSMTAPSGRRLTVIAARILPGAERDRYGEEFKSEPTEITLAGGGRRAQLAYAAQTVLSAAWQLRAALRSPRRRGAVQ